MDAIRAALSIILFIFGCYFAYDLFVTGFDFLILLLVPASFYSAYLIWPSEREETGWIELVGEIIEFPVKIAIAAARYIAGAVRVFDD